MSRAHARRARTVRAAFASRALCALFALAGSAAADARVVHSERSLYQTILVVQQGTTRCLQFSIRRDQRNQSCMDLEHPKHMVFPYTQMMMGALLLNPKPQRILMVGLGGGTLPEALEELFPDATMDIVEIDPAVVDVARKFFQWQPGPRTRIHVQDARVFGKRAALRHAKYDAIFLDAYNGDYIPEHLMTREYLEETKALLADGGVLVANTFSISRLYHHESTTYAAVFGRFFNLTLPESANRIVLVADPLPPLQVLRQRAAAWSSPLARYDIPIESYPARMSTTPDWDVEARVLTDQYSPANLLRERE